MKFINYQEEIENWITDKGLNNYMPLSKNEDFKEFIRSHFPGIPNDVLIEKIHNCAIAIGKDDAKSYSGCLAEALTEQMQ